MSLSPADARFVIRDRHCVTGHEVEARSVFENPFFKPVGVELFDMLGDLRDMQASLVFINRMSCHLGHERRGVEWIPFKGGKL
jgi:hypothetical protein